MMLRSGYERLDLWGYPIHPCIQDDGSPVSVFEYDCNSRRGMMPIAKNALRKLRTTRHPDVLKFMDVVETETTIHIMTERVRPLQATLQSWASRGAQEREDWLLWGLHRVSVGIRLDLLERA